MNFEKIDQPPTENYLPPFSHHSSLSLSLLSLSVEIEFNCINGHNLHRTRKLPLEDNHTQTIQTSEIVYLYI